MDHVTENPINGLPEGWRWINLAEVCEINPRRPKGFKRGANTPTTFVPMAAVDAVRGVIADPQIRPFSEVANGFTYFGQGYLRPYLNKVWVAEFDGLCSVDQYVFTVKKEKPTPNL